MVSPEEKFGSGLALDSNWDLEVDSDGGLKTVSGIDAFERDVAFQLARRLEGTDGYEGMLGQPLTVETIKDIEIAVRRVMGEAFGDQIDSITYLDVSEAEDRRNEVSIEMEIEAADERHDLVIRL